MIKPFLIGIAGGSGSGKTTLAEKLVNKLGKNKTLLISHDHYYLDQSHLTPHERTLTNYDHPLAYETSRLIKDLKSLLLGNSVNQPVYDFLTDTRSTNTLLLASKPIIIVEGILIFENTELRQLFQLKVFLDEADDLRLIRRINRDMQEAGRSYDYVVNKYLDQVRPMYLKFVEPTKHLADLIVPGGKDLDHALTSILGHIPRI